MQVVRGRNDLIIGVSELAAPGARITHGWPEDGESPMQGAEGPRGGDQVPVVEPARLHKAGPVAGVAAQQERLIFYHRAGWTEGYCKKKNVVGWGS